MCGLLILWRRLQVKQSLEINAISKYGSDNVGRSLSVHQISSAEFFEMKKRNDSDSKKNDRENFRKDLPPLVIHKQISGENIDTAGVVCFEEDEKTRLSIASSHAEKSPLQDYLKLVTPSKDEVKSPKSSPMSPRELFFIDLIREADRIDSAKSLKTKTHFPSEATESDNMKTTKSVKDGKDTEDVKNRKSVINVEDAKETKDSEANNKLISKGELSYFIVDVESSSSEKTEAFLQIDSNEGEEMESIAKKPMLQFNKTNLQETSTSSS